MFKEISRMRVRLLAFLPVLCLAAAAYAAERPDVKRLFLLADYPAVSVQAGTTANVGLKLQNFGLPPERFAASRSMASRRAGPRRCSAAGNRWRRRCHRPTQRSISELRLDIPGERDQLDPDADRQRARRGNGTTSLPDRCDAAAKELPAKLKVDTALPALRGTSKSSFEYQLTIKNNAAQPDGQLRCRRAAQLRDLVHGSLWHRNCLRSRSKPASPKDVKLKGASAVDGRCRSFLDQGRSGVVGRRHRPRPEVCARHRRPAASHAFGPRRTRFGARRSRASRPPSRSSSPTPGSAPADDVELSSTGADRLEDRVRTQDAWPRSSRTRMRKSRPASPRRKNPLPGITGDPAGVVARRNRVHPVPRHGRYLDRVGLWAIGIVGVALLFMAAAIARFGRR